MSDPHDSDGSSTNGAQRPSRGRRSELASQFSDWTPADKSSPFDRLPPHDVEAEMCVLGSLLFADSSQFAEICGRLGGGREDFYLADHQVIFDALVHLWQKQQPIDAVILRDELAKRQLLEEVGGAAYIAEIMGTMPSAAYGEHYAGIVREKSLLRTVLESSRKSIDEVHGPHESAQDIVNRAEERLLVIQQQQMGGTGLVRASGAAAYERLTAPQHNRSGGSSGSLDQRVR